MSISLDLHYQPLASSPMDEWDLQGFVNHLLLAYVDGPKGNKKVVFAEEVISVNAVWGRLAKLAKKSTEWDGEQKDTFIWIVNRLKTEADKDGESCCFFGRKMSSEEKQVRKIAASFRPWCCF